MLRDFLRVFAASIAGGLLWMTTIPDYGWNDLIGAAILLVVTITRPEGPAP